MQTIFQRSAIIGSQDDEDVKDLIFLCNPYERLCLFGNSRWPFPYATLTLQWLVSAFTVYVTVNQYIKNVMGTGITFDPLLFPFLIIDENWGWHTVVWTIEFIWVTALSGSVVLVGNIAQVFQGPPRLRKLWAILVNMQTYGFVFVTWVMLVFIGYWMVFKEDYTLNDRIASAYYKVFMTTMIAGGLNI